MNEITIDNSNILTFRDTPWDTAIFGFKTSELVSLVYDDEKSVSKLLDAYEENNKQNGVRFAYTRADSQDLLMKKVLLDRGFYSAETTCKILLNVSTKTDFNAILKCNMEIGLAVQEDIDQIKTIAQSNFNYGRFVEDPYLQPQVTRERNSVWVDDLVRQGAQILVYRKGGLVRSFMIYKSDGKKAELVLGGSDKNLGYLTPLFWSSVLTHLQGTGVRQIETTISAANIVIFNTYMLFGFKLQSTYFGFHKFYAALS